MVAIPMLRAAGEQAVTVAGVAALALVWRGRTWSMKTGLVDLSKKKGLRPPVHNLWKSP